MLKEQRVLGVSCTVVLTGLRVLIRHTDHFTDHLDAQKAGELSTLFDVGGIFGKFMTSRSTLSRT
jgi:hypothetical protein